MALSFVERVYLQRIEIAMANARGTDIPRDNPGRPVTTGRWRSKGKTLLRIVRVGTLGSNGPTDPTDDPRSPVQLALTVVRTRGGVRARARQRRLGRAHVPRRR